MYRLGKVCAYLSGLRGLLAKRCTSARHLDTEFGEQELSLLFLFTCVSD